MPMHDSQGQIGEFGDEPKYAGSTTLRRVGIGIVVVLVATVATANQGNVGMHEERVAGGAAAGRQPPTGGFTARHPGSVLATKRQQDEAHLGPGEDGQLDLVAPDNLWAQAGARYRLDPRLIYAVALVESRAANGSGTIAPQPWIVRINGHLITGTREHVRRELQMAQILTAGIQDVGIMQVHYRIHVEEVRNALELLEPRTNIMIGAKLLAAAMAETSDPVMGVGYYHSHTPDKARYYGEAVMTVYRRLVKLYPHVADFSGGGEIGSVHGTQDGVAHG